MINSDKYSDNHNLLSLFNHKLYHLSISLTISLSFLIINLQDSKQKEEKKKLKTENYKQHGCSNFYDIATHGSAPPRSAKKKLLHSRLGSGCELPLGTFIRFVYDTYQNTVELCGKTILPANKRYTRMSDHKKWFVGTYSPETPTKCDIYL